MALQIAVSDGCQGCPGAANSLMNRSIEQDPVASLRSDEVRDFLFRVRQFLEAKQQKKVLALLRQLPWTHHLT
jgi:hypothetical protein